jgi:hypothetical protein
MRYVKYPLVLLVGAIFVISVFFSYYGVLFHHFPIAPGDDIIVHLANALNIQQNGLAGYGGYPPGLYIIVLAFSKITGFNVLQSLTYLAPILLPLSGLAIYLLSYSLFNVRIALVAYVLYGLVSLQPLQTYFDGSLPNIFTAGIILPLTVTCVVFFIKGLEKEAPAQRNISAVMGLALIGVMLFSHHLTVLVFMVLFSLWLTLLALLALVKTRNPRVILKGLAVVALSVLGGIFVFFTLPVFKLARNLIYLFVGFQSHYPFVYSLVPKTVRVWDARQFEISLSGVIFQGGMIGALLLLLSLKTEKDSAQRKVNMLLLLWFFLYFIGSLSAWTGEPTRLARDLAMPLTITAGYFFVWSYEKLRVHSRPLALGAAAIVLLVGINDSATKLQYETAYSPMVRFSDADQQAYEYIQILNMGSDTNIMALQSTWNVVTRARGTDHYFGSVTYPVPFAKAIYKRCYLIGWYKTGVWPESFSDQSVAKTYLKSKDLTVDAHFSDEIKDQYLMCRKS